MRAAASTFASLALIASPTSSSETPEGINGLTLGFSLDLLLLKGSGHVLDGATEVLARRHLEGVETGARMRLFVMSATISVD